MMAGIMQENFEIKHPDSNCPSHVYKHVFVFDSHNLNHCVRLYRPAEIVVCVLNSLVGNGMYIYSIAVVVHSHTELDDLKEGLTHRI